MATKFTYTDTEVQEIVVKYRAGVSLEVLADQYNKSVASLRMKLVKLGVYQKAAGSTAVASKQQNNTVFDTCLQAVGSALL